MPSRATCSCWGSEPPQRGRPCPFPPQEMRERGAEEQVQLKLPACHLRYRLTTGGGTHVVVIRVQNNQKGKLYKCRLPAL